MCHGGQGAMTRGAIEQKVVSVGERKAHILSANFRKTVKRQTENGNFSPPAEEQNEEGRNNWKKGL